ncbi:MAG: CYTH and CHAD domain-containing protein [Corynebacterium sp.]|nr:CYTH and CHAD domain-containing protein [Corynebacterium sp.]
MSTQTFLEVEAKFAVSDAATLPAPQSFPTVSGVKETRKESLSAIYYDTADLRLSRAKVTLRRRSGGHDDGWHLKLPAAEGRLEVHVGLQETIDGTYMVPAELLDQVRRFTRGNELQPIAQVDNNRTELVLINTDGDEVAEICDDRVTAWSFLPGGGESSWREWEVELNPRIAQTPQGSDFLRGTTALLISAGARVSSSPSKLRTALGSSFANAPLPPSAQQPNVSEDSPAFAVINALAANRDKLLEYDPKVRADEWDSIHQMRVATRELRSHLQTFHGIVAGPEVEYLEQELKALAGLLGVARDAEVVEERWQKLLDTEDSDVLDATTRAHIAQDMGKEYSRAHRHVVAALNSDRYVEMLEVLDIFLANPPIVQDVPAEDDLKSADVDNASESEFESEHADVEVIMARHLGKAYKKLLKRHSKATDNWDNESLTLHEREEYFHDMRKAAKKLRYAAEAAGSATKLKTKPLYKACKQLQSILGDFQDSVTSRDKLLGLADQAKRRGEDTFGYGLLYQRERAVGLKALEDYERAVRDIKKAFKPLAKKMKDS